MQKVKSLKSSTNGQKIVITGMFLDKWKKRNLVRLLKEFISSKKKFFYKVKNIYRKLFDLQTV